MAQGKKRRKKPGPKPGWKKRLEARGNSDLGIKVRVWKPGKFDEDLALHLESRAKELCDQANQYDLAAHTLRHEIARVRGARRKK